MVIVSESEEESAVSELKSRMTDIPEDELYGNDNLFYRFLKARDFNIDSAEKMLRDHLAWRKKKDVKNFSKWKIPEVLEKYLPLNFIGPDKEGNMVRYVPAGNIDWRGIVASCKIEDFEKRYIQAFEEDLMKMNKKNENEMTVGESKQFVYIQDVGNFPLSQATSKNLAIFGIGVLKTFMNNYPERQKCLYFINASPYFYLAYGAFHHLMPRSVKNKVIVYSNDNYKNDFPKMIDAEILPAFLGGKRTDPDGNPLCNTFINHGKPVPEEYYFQRRKRSLANFPDTQQLTLPRADFKEVFVEVKETDCYLEWEFETETRDIGFGLFFEDADGNTTEIIPIVRIDTEEYPETGFYKCEKTGKYIVIFDNTYSILRSKDIYYRLNVRKEQDEENEVVS